MELLFPKDERRKPILRDADDLAERVAIDTILADDLIADLSRTDAALLAPRKKEK